MQSCPKFQTCNAPICILDEDWHKRKHLQEDRCCFYLLSSQKDGAEAIFKGAYLEELYFSAITLAPEIAARYAAISRSIERAKTSPSRMTRFGKGAKNE